MKKIWEHMKELMTKTYEMNKEVEAKKEMTIKTFYLLSHKL